MYAICVHKKPRKVLKLGNCYWVSIKEREFYVSKKCRSLFTTKEEAKLHINCRYEEVVKVEDSPPYTIQELKKAFFDVLDGDFDWYKIQSNTGLPEERCKEIETLFLKVSKELYG